MVGNGRICIGTSLALFYVMTSYIMKCEWLFHIGYMAFSLIGLRSFRRKCSIPFHAPMHFSIPYMLLSTQSGNSTGILKEQSCSLLRL